MEINEVLEKVGLNAKEASVYLALLELGTASVYPIATKAGIKRPTTYLILDDLQRKGLVNVVPREKKVLYTAESPERLISELGRKEELLKRFMPNMLALYNAKKEKPQVQLFEGKEGIRQVYEKIYNSDGVSFFGTIREAQTYDPEGLEAFVERATKLNLKIRDLLTCLPEDLAYAKKAKAGKNYEIKFLPATSTVLTDNAFFGDSVAFFSFHPQIFAVIISSREIRNAIAAIYEFAWAAAELYEGK